MNQYKLQQVVSIRINSTETIRHCKIASIKIEDNHNVKYDLVKDSFRFYDVNESNIEPIEKQAYTAILGEGDE